MSKYLKNIFPWLNYDIAYPNRTDKWWDDFLIKLNDFYAENNVDKGDYAKISLEFKRIITDVNNYVIYPNAKKVLAKCIEMGYKNYLLSNNYPELTKFVEDFGLTEYFSGLIISSHVGYEKPRKELFDYAKNLANCDSGFMVGDNPIADIRGAKENGLKAILVHNESESVADYTFQSLEEILDVL